MYEFSVIYTVEQEYYKTNMSGDLYPGKIYWVLLNVNVIYYWNTLQKAGYSAYISSNSNVLFRTVIITIVLKSIQWVINIFYIFIEILIPINITQTTILHYHPNILLVLLVIIAYYSWTNAKNNFFCYIYSITVIRVNL